jgi:hypothetical protein
MEVEVNEYAVRLYAEARAGVLYVKLTLRARSSESSLAQFSKAISPPLPSALQIYYTLSFCHMSIH